MLPEIKKTNDYSKFKMAYFNREIREITVKKLIKEYETENNFPYFPIVVDSENTIIDGQHRFEACKRKSLPIYYVKKTTQTNPLGVRTVNRAGLKHSTEDTYNILLKTGHKGAKMIRQLLEDLDGKYTLSGTLALATLTTSGGHEKRKLESGVIEIINYKRSLDIGLRMVKLSQDRKVSITLHNIIFRLAHKNDIKPETLLDEIMSRGLYINTGYSKTSMINKIVETYNFRRNKNNRIVSL